MISSILISHAHPELILVRPVHGAQMANAIFTPDGTRFIEVGCGIPPFLKVKSFLSLIDGVYQEINACSGDDKSEMCLDCDGVEWT
jgi:capsular polysaccharide biosynthesis protein